MPQRGHLRADLGRAAPADLLQEDDARPPRKRVRDRGKQGALLDRQVRLEESSCIPDTMARPMLPRWSMDSIRATNVFEEIARLQERAAVRHEGHVAETFMKDEDLRAVLVAMPAGASFHPHQPDEGVVLHVLEELVRVHSPSETVIAPVGTVLSLAEGMLHEVEAERDSAFLLVLTWPTRRARALTEERATSESEIEEALQESMPASDPPAWTHAHAGSPRRDARCCSTRERTEASP